MSILSQVLFAYVSGLVIGGVAASLLELAAGKRLSFAPPFFSRGHVPFFLLSVLAAGPFMLVNDALDARQNAGIAAGAFAGILVTASIWLWALGASVVAIVARFNVAPGFH